MKKLDDIPKRPIFKVPDGYFDELPSKIHSRISASEKSSQPSLIYRHKFAFAIPILTVLAIAFVVMLQPNPKDAETILASVNTEQLVVYLQDTDLTTEDVLEEIEFNEEEIEQIESEVYELDITEDELKDLFGLDNI